MELLINNVEVSTDSEGRYSLNDLHKASGHQSKHTPIKFYRSHGFKAECDYLKSISGQFEPIIKKTGKGGGTWVCKELVYSYAMWISAEFKINVIKTFDSITSQASAPETMQALNELSKKIEQDQELASKCGSLLAAYKKTKKENLDNWVEGVHKTQMKLGFVDDGSKVSYPK